MSLTRLKRSFTDAIFYGKDWDQGDLIATERALGLFFKRNPNGAPADMPGMLLETFLTETLYLQQRGIVNKDVFLDALASVDDCQRWLAEGYKTTEERNALLLDFDRNNPESWVIPAKHDDDKFLLSEAKIKREQEFDAMYMMDQPSFGAFYEDMQRGLYTGNRPNRIYLTPDDVRGQNRNYPTFNERGEWRKSFVRFLKYSRTSESLAAAVVSASACLGLGLSLHVVAIPSAALPFMGFYAVRRVNGVPQPPDIKW